MSWFCCLCGVGVIRENGFAVSLDLLVWNLVFPGVFGCLRFLFICWILVFPPILCFAVCDASAHFIVGDLGFGAWGFVVWWFLVGFGLVVLFVLRFMFVD